MNLEDRVSITVALDTSSLFSGITRLFGGYPHRVLLLARSGKITAFISPFILNELKKALKIKAKWEDQRIDELIKELKSFLKIVHPANKVGLIKDKDSDNRILECAQEAKVRVLITSDKKHIRPLDFFNGIEILSPREFLDKYFSGI